MGKMVTIRCKQNGRHKATILRARNIAFMEPFFLAFDIFRAEKLFVNNIKFVLTKTHGNRKKSRGDNALRTT